MKIEYMQRLEKIESVLNAALPASYDKEWLTTSFGQLPEAVRPSHHISPLVTPCRDLFLRGGKRWRPLLLVLACELSGGSTRGYALTPIVEFVHTASLMHDDIEDASDMRRGAPSMHILYGIDTAVNSASWLFFEAQACIDNFPSDDTLKLRLYKTVSRELRMLHLGQAMDITWHRNNASIPARAEYEAMVRLKTGTLSRLAAELGVLCAGKTETDANWLGSIAADIGVGFQILDDVQNLTTGNPGKKCGDDIVEGKKSLPVIMYLEKNPSDFEVIMQFFEQARKIGIDSPAVKLCIDKLISSGAVKDAYAYGSTLIKNACKKIRDSYPSIPVSVLLAELFESML